MKRFISARSMMGVVVVASLTLLSAGMPASSLAESPCANDFKQYCPDVTPGGGRLLRCYEERKDKFSPACKAWVDRVKTHAELAKETCAKEIDRFCNFEKGDPLEMIDCLQSNYIDLSVECRVKLNEFQLMYPKPVQ